MTSRSRKPSDDENTVATEETAPAVRESSQVTDFTVEQLAERTMERWSNPELREINDYEMAMRAAIETYGEVADATKELGNGFALLSKDDKAKLVGTPFLLLYWTFQHGDYGYFASAAAVTPDGMKFIMNDGSSGMFQDLLGFTQEHNGRQGGLLCPGGLRESTYPTCTGCSQPRSTVAKVCTNRLSNDTECGDESDERSSGTTYYLETSRQPS
jgi:hypothetical protein